MVSTFTFRSDGVLPYALSVPSGMTELCGGRQ